MTLECGERGTLHLLLEGRLLLMKLFVQRKKETGHDEGKNLEIRKREGEERSSEEGNLSYL